MQKSYLSKKVEEVKTYLLNDEPIGEGGNLQHVQQSCFGQTDLNKIISV
jgi:hypothetical protein